MGKGEQWGGGGAPRKTAGMKKGGGMEEDAGIKKGWCGRRSYDEGGSGGGLTVGRAWRASSR